MSGFLDQDKTLDAVKQALFCSNNPMWCTSGMSDVERIMVVSRTVKRAILSGEVQDVPWTPIRSAPPERSGDYECVVLIPCQNGGYIQTVRVLSWNDNVYVGGFSCQGMIVTHWRKLPGLPEVIL